MLMVQTTREEPSLMFVTSLSLEDMSKKEYCSMSPTWEKTALSLGTPSARTLNLTSTGRIHIWKDQASKLKPYSMENTSTSKNILIVHKMKTS
jgi:hypothetical protein